MAKNNTFNFPWREGNQFELLVDGERFFSAMLEAIHSSERFLLLEMYLFESGKIANRFIDALIEKLQLEYEVSEEELKKIPSSGAFHSCIKGNTKIRKVNN